MKCRHCESSKLSKRGVRGNKQRYHCKKCGKWNFKELNLAVESSVEFRSKVKQHKRYVITCAQNNTKVHTGFLKSLLHMNAELIVIPINYQNVSLFNKNEEKEWCDSVKPFLHYGRFNIGNNVTILADLKVNPTATSPLSGLDSISGHRAAIIGHPQIELKSVAVPTYKYPKILTTTGCITERNYSETKAGKKGEFNHTIGACLLEVDGDNYWIRQINACHDGSFIDIDTLYTPNGKFKADNAEAYVCGDEHVAFISETAKKCTYGKKGIIDTIKPKYIVHHDLLDFYSRNHHHKGDPFISAAKYNSKFMSVKDEIKQCIKHINKTTPDYATSIIVASNHIDALTRWIKESDWKNDPVNAELYLETALHMVRNSKIGFSGAEVPDPFEFIAKKYLKCNYVFPGRKKGFRIKGIDISMHGDVGPSGARGTVQNLSKIGVRCITGHGHTPAIKFGHYRVPTMSRLDLEYMRGPSNWTNGGCIVYANGKRSLIIFVGNRWRL